MHERLAGYFALLLYSAGAVGLIWLTVRFLLPWAAPFILAWCIAAALEIPVGFLVRRRWRRSAASAMCTVAALSLLIWGVGAILWEGLGKLGTLARELPVLMEAVTLKLDELEMSARSHLSSAPEGGAMFLEMAGAAIGDALASLPEYISRAAVGFLTRTAQASPNTLLFVVTVSIGSYFISASFPRVNAFLLAQLPPSLHTKLKGLGSDLKSSFGGVFRSQLILMLLTFFQLLVAFWMLRVDSAIELAAVTAIVDALPVFGTGAVLLPWAFCALLLGLLCTNVVLKHLVGRTRPWLVVEGLTHLVVENDPLSFPSGHTCAAFAAGSVWARFVERRWLKAGVPVSAGPLWVPRAVLQGGRGCHAHTSASALRFPWTVFSLPRLFPELSLIMH